MTTASQLAIGVTGHRQYDDAAGVAAAVAAVLDRLLVGGATPTVITSLAEGADRLVADMVLDRGGRIEVILPLAADEYLKDFATEQSREHFTRLLDRAPTATTLVVDDDDSSREHAYERAGHAMVDQSDVVIAVWDGEPARGRGGPAEIVRYAIDHNVMVEIVLVDRDASS